MGSEPIDGQYHMEVIEMELENISRMSYQGSGAATTASGAQEGASANETAAADNSAEKLQITSPQDEKGTSQEEKASNPQIKKAVEDMNRQMKDSVAVFGIHEKTNRVIIKIVDKNTDKVIKEFPPEETLDMIAKVWEVAGILVDEKL